MKSLLNLDKKNFSNEIKIHRDIDDNDIAIIGVSIKVPMAENIDEFRELLKNKVDCMREVTGRRRTAAEKYFKIKYPKEDIEFTRGGFLDEIDEFDYSFFKITPIEARLMNPVHRALLQSTYTAIDDAGYANESIKGSRTGVFIGNIDFDSYKYSNMILETESKTNIDLCAIGNLNSMIPSRISYFLDLKGPSMIIDTACSSALVAIHEACKSILNKECDNAIVGSARLNIIPINDGIHIGMESKSGFVKAFDDDADGTATGEGIMSIFLKTFKKAVEDKDNIYAVIKGSAINQDGSTMGITAPSAEAQSNVMCEAWNKSKINPESIEYFESHGTATSLGDVIELNGIKKAFEKYTDKKQFCAIGSVKSNIGHLYNAAGLASVIKCIIQLKNKELFPTTNFRNPNKKVNFTELPVYVNDIYRSWDSDDKLRTCAISSFGFSGTNCHMILQEYKDEVIYENSNKHNILTLSGKSDEMLLKTAEKYVEFLNYHKGELNLDNICYSANVFKSKYEKRMVVIFKNEEELIRSLEKAVKCEKIDKLILNNNVGDDDLLELAQRYIDKKDVDWNELYKDCNVKKTSIPTYVFDKKSCWIDLKKLQNQLIKDMFYDTKWVKSNLSAHNDSVKHEKILCINDGDHDFSNMLANHEVSVINPSNIEELQSYLNNITLNEFDRIIYGLSCSNNIIANLEDLKEKQFKVLYGLLEVVKELDKNNVTKDLEINILTKNAEKIYDEEVIPENSIIHGLGKVIEIEYPNYKCKYIDFDDYTDFSLIINEIFGDDSNYEVSYRHNEKHVKELDYIDLNKNKEHICLSENDTYIVTGGLGALGKLSCEYLSKNSKVNVLVLGRRFIDKEELNKLDIYIKLKKNNCILDYYSVDVADYDNMKDVIENIKNKYGSINGVIHCAGCGSKGLINNKTVDKVEKVINPKIYGTWNLLNLLHNEEMKFFIMFSSGLTLMAEYGQSDYSAANMYLDSLCRLKFKNIKRILTINWPAFKDVGIGEKFKYENEIFKSMETAKFENIFDKILESNVSRVIVGEIKSDIREDIIMQKLRMKLSDSILKKVMKATDKLEQKKTIAVNDKCDDLEGIQENIKDVCNEVLGFEDIDVTANLLEIGVDSIILAKVHERINEIYPKVISISQMFMYPSVQALSQFIYDKFNEDKEVRSKDIKIEKNLTDDLSQLLDLAKNESISVDDLINKIETL